MDDSHWSREALLDRRFEQEPSYGKRQRIPLSERGTLKQRFAPSCAKCGERVASANDLSEAGECTRCFVHVMAQPADPVLPAEPMWRPSDRSGS